MGGGGYSSFLEKQMRKIYDQFGTILSNKTQTLKFPLLRFVSSNPLLKKISEIRHGIFWEFRWRPGVLRVIQQHYSQHKNHCYIYQLLI